MIFFQPNNQDDPGMDDELPIGTRVYFVGGYDERDRPMKKRTTLTIFRVGNSRTSFDYGVRSASGNEFYVKAHEIERA